MINSILLHRFLFILIAELELGVTILIHFTREIETNTLCMKRRMSYEIDAEVLVLTLVLVFSLGDITAHNLYNILNAIY